MSVRVDRLPAPPPELLFRRRIHVVASVRELWRARELVRTLAERELRARYKQAVLGFGWAIITPVALMVIFTVFFQRVAHVDTGGAPYALFSYLGLLPWTFFSTSVSTGGQSLIQNIPLLNKVYCPREVFPIAYSAVAAVDTTLALLALMAMFPLTRFMPRPTSVWAPLLVLVGTAFTIGVTLVVSALVVYLRDLRHTIPIVLQLGLFATPVAYGIDAIPRHLQLLYSALNPLAPVIDGLRRTVLAGQPPAWNLLGAGAATTALWLVLGYTLFKRLEAGFADVA